MQQKYKNAALIGALLLATKRFRAPSDALYLNYTFMMIENSNSSVWRHQRRMERN